MVSLTLDVTVIADYVTLESGATVDATGAGYGAGQGPGKGAGNVGGSHASNGGRATPGTQYGSLFRPQYPGSGGGGAAGGGRLSIEAGTHVTVDGVIKADGAGAGSSSNGGGSGGSIILKTLYLKGYGTISCSGGEFTRFH